MNSDSSQNSKSTEDVFWDKIGDIVETVIVESVIFKNTDVTPARSEEMPLGWREHFGLQTIEFSDWSNEIKELHSKLAEQAKDTFKLGAEEKTSKMAIALLLSAYRPKFLTKDDVPAATFWLMTREFMFWLSWTMSAQRIRLLYEQACKLGGELTKVNLCWPEVIQRLNDVCGRDIGLVPLELDETKYKVVVKSGLPLLVPIGAE